MDANWLVITIIIALLFDVMNGFHDAANSIATIVSTQVLKPHYAVLWAAFFNFIAFALFTPRVADSLATLIKLDPSHPHSLMVLAAGLMGGIIWDAITWFFGLPTSSSHALLGALSGAGIAFAGPEILRWDVLTPTIIFIIISPLLGASLSFFLNVSLSWILKSCRPSMVDHLFRKGQLFSAALYSIGHGANDAQKTMGVILALMISAQALPPGTKLEFSNPQTVWIILACQVAMSLGTIFGGWRIVKTMGMKIVKLRPIGGFCAETAGALTLFLATRLGIPVSTTHTITGAIIGTGLATAPLTKIRWGLADRIIWAWILTLPASALLGAVLFLLAVHWL